MSDIAEVAAVVLVHEEMRHVAACVRALLDSRHVAIHVRVVDTGSSDAAQAALDTALAPFAGHPALGRMATRVNLGYAGGNNVGIGEALAGSPAYVLVVNDDTVIDADAVHRLVAALRADPGAAAASPSMVHRDAPHRVWWAGGAVDRRRAMGTHHTATAALRGPPRPVGCLCGCAILFRAEALRDVGPFDATYFMYGEDVEWSVRAMRRGWRLLHVPEARIAHAIPYPEPPPAAWKIRLRDRNRRRLVRAHFGAWERWRFAWWFYPTRAVRIAQYLVVGDWPRARAVLQGMTEA